ncbi:hypothetical protein D1872_50620 [compost metagenome]
MISIVEDYLSELVQSKLAVLKSQPQLANSILGLNNDMRERLKMFIQTTPINVIKGYPRGPAEFPCVCILLAGEEETQMGLGDYSEGDMVTYGQGSSKVEYIDRIGGDLTTPHCRVDHVPVVKVDEVVNLTSGSIIPEYAYYLANPDLGIITFSSDEWAVDGDLLDVRYSFMETSSQDLETMFEANYRLEVWTNNGDLTVYLYHLVKWAILSGRGFLDERGLFRQRVSGADFEPATSWFPEFVYRRALMFWCQTSASVPIEDVPFIQDVMVNQTIIVDTEE